MPSTSELLTKYRELPLRDFYMIQLQIDGYSEEAQAAFHIVLEERGGKDALLAKIKKQDEIQQETNRIYRKINKLIALGDDIDEVRSKIKTDLVPSDHVEKLIQRGSQKNEANKKDLKVTPKTLIGGLIGASIGCLLSTILWAGMIIYTAQIFYIVIPALAFICYACIWLFTRQSKKNSVVFLLTIIAAGCAVALGFGIYELVGYQGAGY